METNIVLRATDPARAAAISRAIGISLKDPDRANPGCWHVRTIVSILVTGTDGEEGLSFGPVNFARTMADVAKVTGEYDVSASTGKDHVDVQVSDQLRLAVERDGPRLVLRDIVDVGALFTIEPVMRRNRDEILEALRMAGAANPRLVGNALGRLVGEQRWLLVVDAQEDADLRSIEDLIRERGRGFAPVGVVRSASFAPDHLNEINRLAFDI